MAYDEDATYTVFTRTWWKDNPSWPNGLEPEPGEKTTLAVGCSWAEAKDICKEFNDENDPGRYGLKAEFMEE